MSSLPSSLNELHDIKLKDIRSVFSPARYTRSTSKALAWYAFDLSIYASSVVGILLVHMWWVQLILSIFAGTAVASMFVWAHDAAHGTLFKSRLFSEVLGTIFMLPSMNMYRLWAFGHNRIHHGFTSLTTLDQIWRPWTPDEYKNQHILQRLLYRMERTPYLCALHYLLRVWLPHMVLFSADSGSGVKRTFLYSKLGVLVFFILYSILSYSLAGMYGVLMVVIVPFIIFNYYISLFVFLHHTHPDVPFFSDRDEWSQSIGQVHCSTIVRCSKFSEYLIHNILIHTPHHVDMRIPFYHLKESYYDMREEYAEHIHEMHFSIRNVCRIFSKCKLYDYDAHTWFNFNGYVSKTV